MGWPAEWGGQRGGEVASMVAYLVSEAAGYMCGQAIDVAGGQWMG